MNAPPIQWTTYDVQPHMLPVLHFVQKIKPFTVYNDTITTATAEEALADCAIQTYLAYYNSGTEQAFATKDGALIWLNRTPGQKSVSAWVSADTEEQAAEVLDSVLKNCPEVELDLSEVLVRFWSDGRHGPSSRSRKLVAPKWGEVVENYPERTSAHLSELLELHPPFVGGQLILFHGIPGTGKTTLIRAIAQEWRMWADLHVITDPERFFGSGDYMLSVLLEAGNDDEPDEFSSLLERQNYRSIVRAMRMRAKDAKDGAAKKEPRWQLLIVEDADEFLRVNAKQESGQSLSRLLNLCDGLIGQGLRTLVLITTNTQLDKLHPAVSRSGRCLANIEFDTFSTSEANIWLKSKDVEAVATKDMPLSSLYEILRGQTQIKAERRLEPHGAYL